MKYTLALLMLCVSCFSSKAQVVEPYVNDTDETEHEYMIMTGLTVIDLDRLFIPGATYSMLYMLKSPSDNISFTAGSHMSLGAFYSSFSGGFLLLDAPLLAHVHLGHAATRHATFPFGVMLGTGLGLNYTLASERVGQFSLGPMLEAGIKVDFPTRSVTIKGSYMVNLNKNIFYGDMINVGLMTTFF